jgi:transposase
MSCNNLPMGLSVEDRAELHAAVGSGLYDGSVSSRAQIVLWHDEGYRKSVIAAMSGASRPTVDKWLARYERFGLEGLVSMTSPGGPRQIPDEVRAKVLALTRTTPPSTLGISHWSSTEMARYIKKTEGVYVSQTWVSRLWRENGLKPWRQGTFKISKDPHFEDKVRDVVGLYLDPPEGEVVVSVDAKTGIQALDRTQPLLPIDFGKTQKRTFDYARMGTTDLYAAMDIRTGNVITSLSRTHATPDFLRLMKKVVSAYPGQKVHVVLDNASVHLSSDTEKWLAKQNGEVVFHFTPTGASWMNQIEIWNGIIARKLIRRGTFKSVKALNRDIEAFVKQWNSDCKPIKWTATAEEILDKVRAITAHMDALLRATEIDDVARQAA